VGIWFPSAAIAAKLKIPAGKQPVHFYKLCQKCLSRKAKRHRFTRLIEAAIVARDYADIEASLGRAGEEQGGEL
jgi:hypothetical protein